MTIALLNTVFLTLFVASHCLGRPETLVTKLAAPRTKRRFTDLDRQQLPAHLNLALEAVTQQRHCNSTTPVPAKGPTTWKWRSDDIMQNKSSGVVQI